MEDKNTGYYENYIERTFEEIGAFGKFQKFNMLLMIFVATLPSITIYATVFNLAEPTLKCHDIFKNESVSEICNVWENVTKSKVDNKVTIHACEFDGKFYGKTIFTDWNFYCNRKYLAGLTQTFYLVGTVCGIFSGYFGDRFGRKKNIFGFLAALALLLSSTQFLISGFLGVSIKVKYIIYCFSQLLIGLFCNCLYMTSYVLMIESTTHSYHTFFSNVHLSIYLLGELLVLIPSYFIRNWEINNWIVAGFTAISLIVVSFFLIESPRWLISQKRFQEAELIFKRIATINGKSWEAKNFEMKIVNLEYSINENLIKKLEKKNENFGIKTMMKNICSPKVNCKKSTLFSCVWFSLNLVYYGFSLGVASIVSVNPYLMFIFSCLAEFLGYLVCMMNYKIGRRKALIIYFLLTGFICLVISFEQGNINRNLGNEQKNVFNAVMIIILVSIGKCMASAAFNTCYVFTAENYETNVRNFALLFVSCIGNIGGLVSPQVNLSKGLSKPLPYLIFSLFSLFGSLAVFMMPKSENKSSNYLRSLSVETDEFRL